LVAPLSAAGGDKMTIMTKAKLVCALVAAFSLAGAVHAQDRASGSIKGKVRVETGSPSGVAVLVKRGETEVARGMTDKKGEFVVSGLSSGVYGVTFRKAGLSVGTIDNVEVKAGKTRSLGHDLVLGIDEGSIAFVRGSVFSEDGRSVPNVRIELARVEPDGSTRKIEGRVSNEIGSFVFRLTPEPGKYRLTAKPSGGEAVSKDVEIDGPAVYRIALSVKTKR
jgi:hypothetical protein